MTEDEMMMKGRIKSWLKTSAREGGKIDDADMAALSKSLNRLLKKHFPAA